MESLRRSSSCKPSPCSSATSSTLSRIASRIWAPLQYTTPARAVVRRPARTAETTCWGFWCAHTELNGLWCARVRRVGWAGWGCGVSVGLMGGTVAGSMWRESVP